MFRGLFQPMHLIVILAIVLIIFGPGRLPEIGRGLGESIRGFKKAMSGEDEDDKETPKQISSQKAVGMNKEASSEEAPGQKSDTTV